MHKYKLRTVTGLGKLILKIRSIEAHESIRIVPEAVVL